jgi:Fe-S cluster assembly iron-binding protein IscA
MFEVTGRAAAALAERLAEDGLADSMAIRISTSDSGNGSSAGYQLRFASHPSPGDVVMESTGTRVFLAAGLEEPLAGSVLDLVDTANGPQLILRGRLSRSG